MRKTQHARGLFVCLWAHLIWPVMPSPCSLVNRKKSAAASSIGVRLLRVVILEAHKWATYYSSSSSLSNKTANGSGSPTTRKTRFGCAAMGRKKTT
jgi:hypothetical protein